MLTHKNISQQLQAVPSQLAHPTLLQVCITCIHEHKLIAMIVNFVHIGTSISTSETSVLPTPTSIADSRCNAGKCFCLILCNKFS